MSNFHPLEVLGRDSETQLHVGENLNLLMYHFNPYTAGIDFSRQNLTSVHVDVRFWRLKSLPAL